MYTPQEIEQGFEFLKNHSYIIKNESDKWVQAKTHLDCREGIFKLSLGEFHRQMLNLAAYSIDSVKREDRFIMGQTMAVSKEDFIKIKEIINQAVLQINQVNKNATKKTDIYQIEIATFPLVQNDLSEDENEK